MAKIQLKGKVIAVLPVETVGEKNTKKQSLVFQVPAYVDAFGDRRGEDEMWRVDVIGEERISKFNLTDTLEGKNATIDLYINSNRIDKRAKTATTPERAEMFIINAVLADFKIYERV